MVHVKGVIVLSIIISTILFEIIEHQTENCTNVLYWFSVPINTTNCEVGASSLSFPQVALIYSGAYPFGCDDSGKTICAIGYSANQVVLVGHGKYRLKFGVQRSSYICCKHHTVE